MTYFKSALITSATLVAFMASPALANHHENAAMHDKPVAVSLSMDEKKMLTEKVMSEMTMEDKIAWKAMSKTEREDMLNSRVMAKKHMMMKQGKSDHGMKHDSKKMHDAAMMKDKMMAPTKVNDTIGEILQADGDADSQADGKLLMSDGSQMSKAALIAKDSDNLAKNNAIVVPTVNSQAITTVACPVGTTAQTNGTCMITGNYDYKS